MCWKCCLCLCCCSAEPDEAAKRSEQIDREMAAERAALDREGFRSVEDKNWIKKTLGAKTYFIHGSPVGPAIIKKSGGLDPTRHKEKLLIGGASGDFLLAFPCASNQIPDGIGKLSGAAGRLWGGDDFIYFYIFEMPVLADIYQSPKASGPGAETGIGSLVKWSQIKRVFQRNVKGLYDRNPIADENNVVEI